MRIALCLLTWNEVEGCKADVPGLDLDQFDEVFALDGGSTDGTIEYIESRGITVYKQEIPGYNGAYICAFRECRSDALVFFHPKGSIDPGEALKFREYLESGYDLVVGSRMAKGAVNEEDTQFLKPRKWFVEGLGYLARILWKREGNTILDVLHGLRAMRTEAFFEIDPLEQGVSIDLEMVVRSYKKRTKRIEFPVEERPRLAGDSHFAAFATGRKLLKYLWHEFLRKA